MDLRLAYDPLRALRVAARLVARAPLTLLLAGVGLFLSDVGVFDLLGDGPGVDADGWRVHLEGLGFLGLLLAFPLNAFLQVTVPGAVQRVLVTGEERTGDLLKERGLWTTMMLARALKIGALVATALPLHLFVWGPLLLGRALGVEPLGWGVGVLLGLAYLPIFLYVLLGFLLVEEAVAIEARAPTEAVKRSWEIAEGNRLALALYFGTLLVVNTVGLLLCCLTACLGWFLLPLARTWTEVARTESFLRFSLPPPEGGAWADRSD